MVEKTNKLSLAKTTRRDFLKSSSLLTLSALGLSAMASSCASLDQTLLESKKTERSIAIIGGGIGGLSLGYFLKSQKQHYTLFEAAHRIGGRIYRADNTEWGAYEFFQTDVGLKKIVQTLNLNSVSLDSETWTFENGSADFLSRLKEKSFGLLEHRHLKLQHKLIRIRKIGDFFRLYFKTPNAEVDLDFAHVVLCLPGNQILEIEGLEEFSSKLSVLQTLKSGQTVHALRLVKPPVFNQARLQRNKGVLVTEFEDERVMKVRFNKNKTYFTFLSTDRKPLRELNEIQKLISKNISWSGSKSDLILTADSVLDWGIKENIQSGYFKINFQSDQGTSFFDGKSSLHLISDSFTSGEGRVENVVRLTQKTAGLLSLFV